MPATANARSIVSRRCARAAAIPRASIWAASAPASRWRTNRSDSVSATGGSIGSARSAAPGRGAAGTAPAPRRGTGRGAARPPRRTGRRAPTSGSSATAPIRRSPNRVRRARTSGVGGQQRRRQRGEEPGVVAGLHGSAGRRAPCGRRRRWPRTACRRSPAAARRAARRPAPGRAASTRTGSGPHSRSSPSAWSSISPNAGIRVVGRAGEPGAEPGERLEGGLDGRRVGLRLRDRGRPPQGRAGARSRAGSRAGRRAPGPPDRRRSPSRPSTAARRGRPAGPSGTSRSGGRAPGGSGDGASRGGGVASVGIRGRGPVGAARETVTTSVVAEEVRAAEAAIPLPALGVEDPELRPSPRRPVAAPGDERLGPLADDVAAEPDPATPGELEAEPGRFGDRGREAGASARAARGRRGASPPAGRGPPGGAAGRRPSPGSCRRFGRGGRSMTRTSTERAARSIPAIDRPSSSVSGVRTTSQSSRTPRATASTGSSARARSSQATIAPSAWASATRRRARVVAPELGAPRSATPAFRGSPPGPTIASRSGKPVRTIRSTPVRGSPAGEGASPIEVIGRIGRQRRRGQRPDHLRSCSPPPRLERRQSRRDVRGEAGHRTSRLEHLFDIVNGN